MNTVDFPFVLVMIEIRGEIFVVFDHDPHYKSMSECRAGRVEVGRGKPESFKKSLKCITRDELSVLQTASQILEKYEGS